MKILILQLARLGDILMTWPAVRALRRTQPDAEIHLLVRPRFESATHGFDAADRVHILPTTEILEPLVRSEPSDRQALERLEASMNGLRGEGYDEIYNLSFSPLSSWITKTVAKENAKVRGYTRHHDGWLKIADDVSSYFHAQVGPGRPNRVHLTDLFAAQLGVEMRPEDWRAPNFAACDFGLPENYIVLHPGASEAGKIFPAFLWGRTVKKFCETHPGFSVVVIGTAEEAVLANEIRANAPGVGVIDLTGRTRFEELFQIVGGARALMGGDSAPLHVASFTGTPCLNVSLGGVNFWETGPKAAGSVVLRVPDSGEISSEDAARALTAVVDRLAPTEGFFARSGIPSFDPVGPVADAFDWQLTRALYLEGDFPITDDAHFVMAIRRLREMNEVVIDQLTKLSPDSAALGQLMDRADEILQAVSKMVPDAGVLVRWTLTEKSRIPPSSRSLICDEMRRIHDQLAKVLRLYDMDAIGEEGGSHGTF